MKNNNDLVQIDLLIEFFKKNPNRDIRHPEVVDWVVSTYMKRTGKVFRDPDRAIRKLAQSGFLIKIAKGIYKYDPSKAYKRELEDFTAAQKEAILKRDGYKCVICGRGEKDGVELHVDHIKPKDLGGEATIENGQTLCSQHNFMKKNLQEPPQKTQNAPVILQCLPTRRITDGRLCVWQIWSCSVRSVWSAV